MRYAINRYIHYTKDMAYRFYITDELYYSGHNKTHQNRWADIIKPAVPTKSGEEIAEDIIERAGLIVNESI